MLLYLFKRYWQGQEKGKKKDRKNVTGEAGAWGVGGEKEGEERAGEGEGRRGKISPHGHF